MKVVYGPTGEVIDAFCVRDLIKSAASDWKSLPARIREGYESGDLIFTPESIHMNSDCGGWGIIDADDFLLVWPTGVVGTMERARFEGFFRQVA